MKAHDDKHGEDLNKDLSSLPVAGREKHLHNDMDAQRWAREFIKKNVGLKVGCALVDEGTMLGWFANAIMCGYDEARRREAISSEASAPSTIAPSERALTDDEISAAWNGAGADRPEAGAADLYLHYMRAVAKAQRAKMLAFMPSATARKPLPVECCGGGLVAEDCCGFPIKRPGGSVPLAEIPEEVIVHLALATGPDSAAQKVLDEAAEIRARGGVVRFLFDGAGLCVQEGVVMNRADGGKACSCGATAGQYHAAGCGYEGVFNG